jgi:hypothetical protein
MIDIRLPLLRALLLPSFQLLTPKCRPRDFRVRTCANSTKCRLCRFKGTLTSRNLAGIRD